jgi:hypothetical protein
MPNLNLNELLRSGFAGAVFMLVAMGAFDNPRTFFSEENSAPLVLGALTTALGLTIGVVIYAIHRAVPYPLLYFVMKTLTNRKHSMLDLDVMRWKHSMNKDALQHKLQDWAAQVHFLYCLAWASVVALILGNALGWKVLPAYGAAVWLFGVFGICALWHHYRYQLWERRVFEEDAASALRLAAQTSEQSSPLWQHQGRLTICELVSKPERLRYQRKRGRGEG